MAAPFPNPGLSNEEIQKLGKVLRRPRIRASAPLSTSEPQVIGISFQTLQSSGIANTSIHQYTPNTIEWTRKLPTPTNITDKSFYANIVQTVYPSRVQRSQELQPTTYSRSSSSPPQDAGNGPPSIDVDPEEAMKGISAQSGDLANGTLAVDREGERGKEAAEGIFPKPVDTGNAMDVDDEGEAGEEVAKGVRRKRVEADLEGPLKRKNMWNSEGESELSELEEVAESLNQGDRLSDNDGVQLKEDEHNTDKRRLRSSRPPKAEVQQPDVVSKGHGGKKGATAKKASKGTKNKESRITPPLDETYDPKVYFHVQ